MSAPASAERSGPPANAGVASLERDGALLLGENAGVGGINTYMVRLAEGLRGRGIPAEIATVWPKEDRWLEPECARRGIPLAILASARSVAALPGAFFRLVRLLRRRDYAVLHTQANYSDLVGRAAWLTAGRRAALVATVHDLIPDEHEPRYAWRLMYRLALRTRSLDDATIAVSEPLAHGLGKWGVGRGAVDVIHNGTVVGTGPVDRGAGRAAPTVLFVGRLSSEKGCAVLLEAARLLVERGRRFKLVFVGDGPERPSLERTVHLARLGSYVAFEGWKLDVSAYYTQADVVAVPSLREGLSLTALEAMASGVPVIASRTGGLAEIVLDEETGLLVEPGDGAGLAAALDRCLADPALRRRLGDAGRRRALERYSVATMVERTIAVYRRSLLPKTP